MKYPFEYWTGRMCGLLEATSENAYIPEHIRIACARLVKEFEKDFDSTNKEEK